MQNKVHNILLIPKLKTRSASEFWCGRCGEIYGANIIDYLTPHRGSRYQWLLKHTAVSVTKLYESSLQVGSRKTTCTPSLFLCVNSSLTGSWQSYFFLVFILNCGIVDIFRYDMENKTISQA